MPEGEVCEIQGVRQMKSNPWAVYGFLVLGLLPLLAMIIVPLVAGMPSGKEGGAFMRVMFYAVAGGLLGSWMYKYRRKAEAATHVLRATRKGLELDGAMILPRGEISTAVVMPDPSHGTIVRLEATGVSGRVLDFLVSNVGEGRAVLHALGLDPTQSATALRITSPSLRHYRTRTWLAAAAFPFAMIVAFVVTYLTKHVFGASTAALSIVPVMMLAPLAILQVLVPAKIRIGADGLLVSWMGRRRYHPLSDLVRAEVVEGPPWETLLPILVRLTHKDGSTEDLVAAMGRGRANSRGFNRQVLLKASIVAERINEAIDARAGRGELPIAWNASVLARAARPIGDWITELRAMVDRTQTFREGVVLAVDQLWRVIEDPEANAEHRAAAAVALGKDLDDEARTRLRVAAESTVAPRLRVAFEAAADANESRLADALEEIEAEKQA